MLCSYSDSSKPRQQSDPAPGQFSTTFTTLCQINTTQRTTQSCFGPDKEFMVELVLTAVDKERHAITVTGSSDVRGSVTQTGTVTFKAVTEENVLSFISYILKVRKDITNLICAILILKM